MYSTATPDEIMATIIAGHFLNYQPTDDEVEAFRRKWIADGIVAKIHTEKRIRQQVKIALGDQAPTQLITISIDKELSPELAIKSQKEVMQVIKLAKYNCLENVSYSFEYYSSNGWNPHIHIKTDKLKADSQVAQLIRRKIINKHNVYYINVSSKTEAIHSAYITGDKKAEKTDDTKKDEVFRENNNLQDIYEL